MGGKDFFDVCVGQYKTGDMHDNADRVEAYYQPPTAGGGRFSDAWAVVWRRYYELTSTSFQFTGVFNGMFERGGGFEGNVWDGSKVLEGSIDED